MIPGTAINNCSLLHRLVIYSTSELYMERSPVTESFSGCVFGGEMKSKVDESSCPCVFSGKLPLSMLMNDEKAEAELAAEAHLFGNGLVLPVNVVVSPEESEPVDVETCNRAFLWCHMFLPGAWKRLKFPDFSISTVSGGLSNRLYLCSLPPGMISVANEPRVVLLRIYGRILQGESSVILESVMFAILAERSLGPKLYGVFPEGRLEEFVSSRKLLVEELGDPEISAEIAVKLAGLHQMCMPFNKQPSWLFSTLSRYIEKVKAVTYTQALDQERLRRLLMVSLPHEMERLRVLISAVQSPVVYCHNDLQEGNILMLEGREHVLGSRLMLIDFEYSSYNYRGFDIANFFCEWTMDYTKPSWPYFSFNPQNYPSREKQDYAIARLEAYFEHKKNFEEF
uniref:choline kinase alpha-like isoform X3 n=1 Tax=Myxine glutinosa TaxID=7769 RepID=UPI00358F70EF